MLFFHIQVGCEIGARPIDLHLSSFKKMGIQVEEKAGFIKCSCDKIVGADINLDFPSVGATENIILAAVLAEGVTIINNAAMEPEIVDLANCLNRMGAKIQGAGSNVIKITGVKKLKGTGYKVMPDRIEAGTFLCATAITGGKVKINNVIPEHIVPVIHKLQEAGCNIITEKNSIEIDAPKKLKAIEIKTMPYPGFPTDLQQIFGSILTIAKGTSIIIENIFENRFKYVNELIRMGAKITTEGRTVVIQGKRKLIGTTVQGSDLRGGAGLVIAGLVAKGTTKVENIEYVLRGYENLDYKLNLLGANIKRVGE
jgi:UDP-N-acetylglucosamine 1-carboxyvinyltransferase